MSHRLQVNGLSPVCIHICVFMLLETEKDLSHWLQGNGSSPVCIFKCIFRWSYVEKDLSHWLQGNGFSPVNMYPEMCLQVTRGWERPFTLVAGEWLLSAIHPHMCCYVTGCRERLITQITVERLFTRVSPNMTNSLLSEGKLLSQNMQRCSMAWGLVGKSYDPSITV